MRKIKFINAAMYFLNKKFDQMEGNKRFLVFLALIIPGFIGINGYALHDSVLLSLVGFCYMFIIALGRIGYVDGWINIKRGAK